MIKKTKYPFSILLISLAINCASLENLQFNNDCCKKKPSKLYLTINEKQPKLENKFQKSYLTFLDYLLKKRDFTIITQFDQKYIQIDDESLFIDFHFDFSEDSQIIVGGGKNYRTYVKGPQGMIGIQGKKTKDTDPVYSMLIMMTSDYKYDPVSKKYSIQNSDSLLLKFANLYSNIIHNIYVTPSTVEGKYFDLVNENLYEIKKENGIYNTYFKGKNSESYSKPENYSLTFEKIESTQDTNNFVQYKGKEKKYINSVYDVNLIQFGNMLIIKNPFESTRNILNQAVIFQSDTYLVKIE
ncbi:hypothetical protein LFX15_18915 [Leptospira levettii]|uniref:hypothetical protein n=1 Tax=Leptospira levettii TaxID=2023178 RepID=UPI001EEBB4EB|nr:hypothetical protein [Leptospira levettii]MCG6150374.1 hypothetical protein [Leptospira levettii]